MQELQQGVYSGNVTMARGKDGFVACVTAYNEDNFNNSLHYHVNAHFCFALEGGCVERKKDSYEINPGNIVYYGAGEQHQVVKIAKSTRRVNLEIDQSFFHRFNIPDELARRAVTTNPDAKFLMVKMYLELLANDSFSEVSIQMLLLQLISRIKKAGDETRQPNWVKTVRSFLHDNDDGPITLADLSFISNMHPVTISKQFPRYFSCTVGEYKRKLKIEKALSLVKSRPVSLTDVAYECGFFDQPGQH